MLIGAAPLPPGLVGFMPMPEGRLLLDEIQRAFAGFERSASAAASFLPRVLHRFTKTFPRTAAALRMLPSTEVARLVQTQDCDLGVVEGALSPPGLAGPA